MHALKSVKVQGFKSIKDMDLKLRPLNVLIGPNGAGKSNFISLFKLLNQIVLKNLQVFVGKSGGANTFLYFGSKITNEIFIHCDFNPNGYSCKLGPSTDDSLIFLEESAYFQGAGYKRPYEEGLGEGHKETKLHTLAKQKATVNHVLKNMESWRVYHFHDTSESSKMKQTGEIDDNEVFRPDASNLAAFLYFLQERHKGNYKNIVETVRLAAPFFDDFFLRPSKLNKGKILLEWHQKGSDDYFNAHTLSDGTLRFICLATLLLQPELPSVILLDEPELGLHPYAVALLADLLKSTSTKTQIIASTQSVGLVNQFEPADIVVVDRQEGQSVFSKLEKAKMDDWLEEYGLGDLWEKNILGGRPTH